MGFNWKKTNQQPKMNRVWKCCIPRKWHFFEHHDRILKDLLKIWDQHMSYNCLLGILKIHENTNRQMVSLVSFYWSTSPSAKELGIEAGWLVSFCCMLHLPCKMKADQLIKPVSLSSSRCPAAVQQWKIKGDDAIGHPQKIANPEGQRSPNF